MMAARSRLTSTVSFDTSGLPSSVGAHVPTSGAIFITGDAVAALASASAAAASANSAVAASLAAAASAALAQTAAGVVTPPPIRAATASANLASSDVHKTVIGDLSTLGAVARTLPNGAAIADGSVIRILKDYSRAEGAFNLIPFTGQTVCNQPSLKFTRDGQAADFEWDATTSDWKMVGQSFAAFRSAIFTQEHDYTTASSLASPSIWSWDENGTRYSQSNTTTGDHVFRIDNIIHGALQTLTGASFSPIHAAAEKVSDDRNKVVYYAAVGESYAHGASTHPGFVLEKCYQARAFHTLGVENETLWTYDPHDGGVCDVRLSVTNGDPWPSAAVAATQLLWLTADKGDRIFLPNTTADGTHRIGHVRHVSDASWGPSIVRDVLDSTYGYTAQANSKHNVFAHIWTDGRIVLILGAANATDATELERGPDGFPVNKTGLPGGAGVQAGSGRLVGHIYADAAGKIVWPGTGNIALPSAPVKIGLRNLYNRRKLHLSWSDDTVSSYTYTSGVPRLMNGNTNAYIAFAQGLDDAPVRARTQSIASGSGGTIARVSVQLDAVSAGAAGVTSSARATIIGEYRGYPTSGLHTIGPYESSLVGGTVTFEPFSAGGNSYFEFEGEF